MTVTAQNSSTVVVGNATRGPFNITFPYWDNSEVSVYLRTTSTGAISAVKTSPTDFTFGTPHVGGVIDGTITFTAAHATIPATEEVIILRTTAATQAVDLTPSTKFPSAPVEEGLDRVSMRMQEALQAFEDRGLRIPRTDELGGGGGFPDMQLPNTAGRSLSGVGGGYLGFDLNGAPVIFQGVVDPDLYPASAFGTTWIAYTTNAIARDALLADAAASRATLSAVEDGGNAAQLNAGTEAAKGTAGDYGKGFYWATDDLRLWYSNGSIWSSVSLVQLTNTGLPTSGFRVGRVFLDVNNKEPLYDNSSALVPLRSPWCQGTIGGLTLSRTGAEQITVAAGEARAITGLNVPKGRNITLTAAIAKNLGAANTFEVGNNMPGMALGVAQAFDTWYFVFLIADRDGNAEVAIDDNILGTNILSVSANLIKTAGYDKHARYIGAFRTNATGAGEVIPFTQNGDHFQWNTSILSYSAVAQDFTSGLTVAVPHAPPNSLAEVNWLFGHTTLTSITNVYVGSILQAAAPSQTVAPLYDSVNDLAGSGHRIHSGRAWVRLDGSSQMRIHTAGAGADISIDADIVVRGWVDDRGRDL